jgi:hypothetical protein
MSIKVKCGTCGSFAGWGECDECERARSLAMVEAEKLALQYGDASLFSVGQPETDFDQVANF